MSSQIACPACGEADDLRGAETPDGIRIECGECGESWLRDAQPPTCATCGGAEVVTRSRALTQYSRGTQLSIVGIGEILLCRACDSRMVEWTDSSRAVPFDYRSSALDPDAADQRDDDSEDVLMTP